MTKFVIGVDPDSDKNGVAIFNDGVLVKLEVMYSHKLYELLKGLRTAGTITVSIEDLTGMGTFQQRVSRATNIKTALKMAEGVGKCKQAQIETMRICDELGIRVVTQKPSKRWKSQEEKKLFERATGWSSRSNEETRSAAFMGFLETRN
ncbi:hypothetical protein R7070_04595 [Vibrio sp. 1557]|uniref:hypothetical protein n=1 Tax=Vibrio sp. 1557 TaxID=3074561 RepID=UPI0023EC198D|nr:hypothetical protein [Vibrio sp. 1557]MDF4644938.1 hypothetical protein [Vibrio parahaemolyticus]MDW2262025.1 hypothetical protein [Vibrio sp. 1557]